VASAQENDTRVSLRIAKNKKSKPIQMEVLQKNKTKTITGAEALIQCLVAEQVDTIFGYPGGAIMPIYDALHGYREKVNHILVRHEQGATHSAQGYARVSGKVGVVFATSGPGATNLITGIADAQIDSTPMVCITGQVASSLLGTDAFQETDVMGISMPVTKWNVQITKAEEIPAAVAKAFYIARSGRPGPVVIDITKDAQFQSLDFDYEVCNQFRSYVPKPEIEKDLSRYAKQAKVIHLELDPAEINKNVPADVAVLGDCKLTLPLITNAINKRNHSQWLEQFNELYQEEYKAVIKKELNPAKDKPISMGEVIKLISDKTNGESIIVTDVGQHQMVAQRYYQFSKWRSNVTSGGLGTMGFALPAAIGAKFGAPDRQVIAVIGDGGFQMTIQELGTIYQSGVDVKILILNNEFLGMVRQWQEMFFDRRYSFTEMINPDFQTISKGYHIPSQKVEQREGLNKAIDTFLNSKGSFLLEVVVGKENNVFPMVPSGASVSDIRLK